MLECDASNVVRCIRERREGATPIFLFYDDIFQLSSSFLSFDCAHVKRVRNTIAHSVARWEADVNSETICTTLFPKSLQTLVELDLIKFLTLFSPKKKLDCYILLDLFSILFHFNSGPVLFGIKQLN